MKKVLLLIVFVLIFCVGAVGLYNKVNDYKKGEEEYNELEQYFVQSDGISQTQDDNSNNSQDNVSAPTVNFIELLTVNKDIVEIAKKLKDNGYNLFVLSNMANQTYEYF